jgi:purine-binding chemotaxis protein CheW
MSFKAGGSIFAIECDVVREVILFDTAHQVAGTPAHVRGVANVRGSLIQLVDMDLLLGLPSYRVKHDAMLREFQARRADHLRWLAELRSSVVESRSFTLTTDPTKCAFGRWYGAYQAPDPVLALKLAAFDAPHRKIHAVGADAVALVAAGREGEAMALIERASERELARLLELFDETTPLLHKLAREVVVIVTRGTHTVGLVVEDVCDLLTLSEADLEEIERSAADLTPLGSALLFGVRHLAGEAVMLLSAERIFEQLVQ